jgi:peptidyl-prolyl cis-trans isomerase C
MTASIARLALAIALPLVAAGPALAQVDPKSMELIRRGDAVLTLGDLDGRMARLADTERSIHARDPANLSRMIDRLLVNRQLAIEARALGLDEDPDVRADVALAIEEVLATHRLNLLVRRDNIPDFSELARERYMADPAAYGLPEARRVVHVLIDTDKRTDEEALARAREVHARATDGQTPFRELVDEYSDDPTKASAQGHITVQRSGEFVPEFETAARALAEPGDVSEPVKTRFGYHVIKLLEIEPAKPTTFEDVKDSMADELRDAYINEVRGKHVSALRGLVDVGNEELMLTLPARYGGRPEEAAGATQPTGAAADAGR